MAEQSILNNIKSQANSLIDEIKAKIDAENIPAKIKEGLVASKDELQSLLNSVFIKSGIIDQSQLSDAQVAIDNAKKNILEYEKQQTTNRLLMWGVSIAALITGGIIYRKMRKK